MIHLYGREQQARGRRCFPAIFQCTGTKSQQKRYTFGAFGPFGTPKNGRARQRLSKVCPHRDTQEFCRIKSFFFPLKIAACLWQTKPLSHHPQAERYEKVCNSLVLLGFYLGKFSADLLLRGSRMWYHKSTNRRKRFISRKNVFLIVGKVPAEVVGRKPM